MIGRGIRAFVSGLGGFVLELGGVLGPGVIRQFLLRVRDNDILGLAGQLAYFFLLSSFPFLISVVALAGLVIGDPQTVITGLIERASGFLPQEAIGILSNYTGRTLDNTGPAVLFFGIAGTLWLGSAAAIAISKAANRAYRVDESRSFFRLRGTSILLAVGFTFLVAVLILSVVKAENYVQGLGGAANGETFTYLWTAARWVVVFLAATLALGMLYYLAPNVRIPFRWVTPGGVVATGLMFAASIVFSFYVSRLGSYDQVYGQLATVIVFMIWLYTIGLTVLSGLELNAVLALRAEERERVTLRRPEKSGRRS
ncbi:YihY/virulence factor BrkB family protein [Rubrobacter aplysinae]|uniref:YihY/virulence factor BrkB family protein n=1 Tax=Rubrobacter aplysinae TaxID=909625 RepID=UPI00064B9212|nr:YihY/virulence factor BrkB family protein [Rubrobacter aplysinae]